MKSDRKIKPEKTPPKVKAVKGVQQVSPKTNGKHPLASYEHIPIGIVECALDGKYMDVNEEFCRITGYTRNALLRRGIRDLTHEDDYALDTKLHEQLIAGEIPFYRLEKRYVCKDGGHTWVELTRSLVRNTQGKPLYTIGVVLDISERKQVERVLRESVERLRLATEAAQMFTWEWDFQNNSYSLSDSFTQVLGFQTDLLPKNAFETISRFVPAEDLQSVSNAFQKVVENQGDLQSLPCRVINPTDGQTVWLEISAKIVYDLDGNPERMFGVAQNITESKNIQNEITVISRMPAENPNPVMRIHRDGKILYANPASAALLEDWMQGLQPVIPEELQTTIKQTFTSGMKMETEFGHAGKHFSFTVVPLVDAGYVNLYGKDITERKKVESELAEYARQQEALYRLSDRLHRTESLADVFDAALDAILNALQCDRASILLYDDTDVMRFVAWRGLSDAYRQSTEGHSPWKPDAIHPKPISMDDVRTADVSESLRVVIVEEGIGALAFIPLVVHEKLIGKFMIYYNATHTFDEAELDLSLTIANQLAAGIDRRRAEEERLQSEERFRTLANAMPSIVWTAAPDGAITYANDQWFRYAGITPEENAKGWPELVLHPDDYERCIREWTHALQTVPDEYLIEVRNRRYDGSYRWFQTRAVPARDASGNVRAWYGVTTDIHERIEAEHRMALLAGISDMLRNVDDPSDLMYRISEAVGEHLHVKRALFNETDLEQDREIVHRDYHNGQDSVAGIHKVSEYSSLTSAEVAAGRTVVNTDSKIDPRTAPDYERTYAISGERAYVAIPLMRDNRWVATFWVSDDTPRQWSGEEIALLETVAERTWALIEKLRLAEELRAKEAELEAIINQTPFMLTRCTRDLRYRFVSRAYADMIGRSPGEVAGKPIAEIMGEAGLKTISPYIEKVLQGQQVEYETAVSFEGVGAPYLRVIYTPDWDEQGNVVGWFASIVDIRERKRIEEALSASEKMFSTMVDAAPFGVYFIDSEFRLRAINRGSEAVFSGVDPLIGRDFAEIVRIIWNEPFATEAIERFRHTLRTGESYISPTIIEPRANINEIQAYDWQIHRITMADGTFGVVCYFYDLSEQKQMEAAVRASEALYRTIARSIPGGGVYVVDKDFRYLVAEGPVTEAFGLSREMFEGHTVSEVFPDERGQRMEARLRQNFAGETVDFETEFNGHVYWTQQAPLLDSIGQAIILTLDITERKRAEEALRQSEERFVQFMQHLPGLAWIKDIQGGYVYANAATEKAFSTPREKLYGRSDEEIFPLEVATQFKENDQRALTEGQGIQVIETLEQEDGVLHYSLVSKFPIPGPDGSPALIGGTAFDITERLQADETLRESEERFSAILRQATAGIVRKDADGKLIFVNQAFCNMLGYTEEELVGKMIWELMYPDDVAENKKSYDRLMAEGIPFKLERRLLREDGLVIWVDASVSPIMDATGKPQSAVAVEVDITGRKQAEEALRELNLQLEDRVLSRTARLRAVNQTLREEITERKRVEEALRQSEFAARTNEEKLRTLFDLLPVGISFLSPEGQIIQMNSALPNILKLSKEELLSQTYKSRKYIRANGMPMSADKFASARALAEGRTVHNIETGILLENGEVIWTNVSAAPVDVADVGVVVVTVDITDSKRAERALQESHQRLRILSQRLVEVQEDERRALARELHDRVGQTLAALNINLIIINSELSGEAAEQIGTRLNDSMKLVAETIALVRDVMTDLRPAVLDDYGLEAALESHLAQFISRYDISAKWEKPDQPFPRLGPSVEMTMLRIAQEALMNIARHAKATQVNLSLRQEANTVSLTIQDNGIGIESWQDANRPGSHGLTIMRERAEAFDGNLKVKSVPGQGTIVEVNIPFTRDAQNEAQELRDL
jgi:PAS domain S-box-containing protein